MAGGSAAELDGRNFSAESTDAVVRHELNLWSYFYKVKRVIALAASLGVRSRRAEVRQGVSSGQTLKVSEEGRMELEATLHCPT